MVTLSRSEAIALVRKNLDEVEPNGSAMYLDENNDNLSLDDIIAKNIPEAINATNLMAPVWLLEGEDYTFSGTDTISISDDGVLSFSIAQDSKYLRLVAFKAADSNIVLTDTIAEASPEGRKQLNIYIRGTFDRPRLVIQQGRHTGPAFKYYTIADPSDFEGEESSAIELFQFVKEQLYASSTTSYNISRRIRQNIIDYLTALVLETYGDQRAQTFFQKANSFPII